jgi:hypothetical protein
LEKTTVPDVACVVPAEIATPPPPPAATLAVITLELFIPKLTPLRFENKTVPVVFAVCVPAARMFTPSPAPAALAEIITLPLVIPTEIIPAPWNERERASTVLEDDAPVVLLTAYTPIV